MLCTRGARGLGHSGFLESICPARWSIAILPDGFPRAGLKGESAIYGRMPKPKEQQIQIPPGTVIGGVDVNLVLNARYKRGLFIGLAVGIVLGVFLGLVL